MPQSAAVTSVDSERYGIHLDWPEGWSPRHSDDFVLELAPGGQGAAPGDAETISLDVPDLPPHVPGMIPLRLVVNGFLDDLKKDHPSLQVVEQKDVSIPQESARRVVTTWKEKDGTEYRQDALVMVHSDRVYIIRGTAPMKDADRARGAFDKVVSSLKWISNK
jgi:hypothetical protein